MYLVLKKFVLEELSRKRRGDSRPRFERYLFYFIEEYV